MRRSTLYYGWFDRRTRSFRVSRLPPDAPVRPSLAFSAKDQVDDWLNGHRRAEILWSPPLRGDEPSNPETFP